MWRKPHIDIGKWYILVLTIAFQEFPYFFFLHNVESWLIKVTSTSVGFWPALRSANWRSCAEKTKRAKCQLEGHHRDQIQVVLEIIKLFLRQKINSSTTNSEKAIIYIWPPFEKQIWEKMRKIIWEKSLSIQYEKKACHTIVWWLVTDTLLPIEIFFKFYNSQHVLKYLSKW